jgi:hypothetical protein
MREHGDLAQWHVIARRALAFPILALGLGIAFVGAWLGWSWGDAVRLIRDAGMVR